MRFISGILLIVAVPLHAQDSIPGWGPSIDGLQVAISPVGDASYGVGDTAEFELSIRNVGTGPIEFSYVESTISQWIPRFVEQEDDPPPVVWVPRYLGGTIRTLSLPPQASVVLGRCKLEFRALDSSQPLTYPAAFARPGTHRVTALLHIEHPIWRAEEPMVPKLALTSGAVEISVRETGWKESPAREQALRVLADTHLAQLRYQRSQGQWSSAAFLFYTQHDRLRAARLAPEARSHLEHIAASHDDPHYSYLAAELLR